MTPYDTQAKENDFEKPIFDWPISIGWLRLDHRQRPNGKDEYMIAREDNNPAASLGAIKAATFREAATFCASQGKTLKTLKESDTPRSFGQFPQPNLQFSCI